jgi:hypothetical protein
MDYGSIRTVHGYRGLQFLTVVRRASVEKMESLNYCDT